VKTSRLIREIFSQPTAPFREGWVLRKIESLLTESKIPYFCDRSGNIIAGAASAKKARLAKIAFLAHTDHPGFHVVKQSKRRVDALWLGGAPFKTMKGSRVRLFDPARPEFEATGRLTYVSPILNHHEGIVIKILLDQNVVLNTNCFGAFDFDGLKRKGDKIITRVADDFAGVVMALGMLMDTKRKTQTLAIFTRAEEVGFIGCLALLKSEILNPKMAIVSLEASRTLDGALIGQGPVLRLGDRTTLFHTDLCNQMWQVALGLKKKKKTFQFQRRVMDGGSCEATALGVFGFATSGLSVPLGNYHNQGKHGPAPEIVSMRDVENGRIFCTALADQFQESSHWTKGFRTRLEKELKLLKPKLLRPSLDVFEHQGRKA
jgi:putative aminopeptidase FrvX